MAIFNKKGTVGRFFHRAAAVAVTGAAILFALSGCGSGTPSSGENDGQNSTLTRSYVPLHSGDTHVFFAKFSADDTDTTSIEESVSGPTESINGINANVFQTTTTQITVNLFGIRTLMFSTFQNVTDRGLINYGTDSFTQDQGIVESIRYIPTVVLPFGLERGRSTTIQRLDFNQVYSSNSPVVYESQVYRFTNEGRETVRVPMGTFDCIKIKQEIGSVDLKNVTQVRRFWYAENIGLIQYREEYPNETTPDGLSYQAVSASVSGKQYP